MLKLAGALPASLQSIRWVAYGALSLGAVAGLTRCIELESDSKPQASKVEKPLVDQGFKPELREVKETARVPTAQEKQEVRKALDKCGLTFYNTEASWPDNDNNNNN